MAQEQVNITLLIMNDGGYGVMRGIQDKYFAGRQYYNELHTPAFTQIAEAMGLKAWKVDAAAQFNGVLAEAINYLGPSVVEVDMKQVGPLTFAGPPQKYDKTPGDCRAFSWLFSAAMRSRMCCALGKKGGRRTGCSGGRLPSGPASRSWWPAVRIDAALFQQIERVIIRFAFLLLRKLGADQLLADVRQLRLRQRADDAAGGDAAVRSATVP